MLKSPQPLIERRKRHPAQRFELGRGVRKLIRRHRRGIRLEGGAARKQMPERERAGPATELMRRPAKGQMIAVAGRLRDRRRQAGGALGENVAQRAQTLRSENVRLAGKIGFIDEVVRSLAHGCPVGLCP